MPNRPGHIVRPVLLAGAIALLGAVDAAPVISVPRVDGLVVDGRSGDWGGRGYRVRVLDHARKPSPAADDFDPRLRLGWDDDGLVVLVEVADGGPRGMICNEATQFSPLRDGVECRVGLPPTMRRIVLQVAATFEQVPCWSTVEPRVPVPFALVDGGRAYCLEFRLGPDVLGGPVAAGRELPFALRVDDLDLGGFTDATFPGRLLGGTDRAAPVRLRLAPEASPGIDRLAVVSHRDFLAGRLEVYAAAGEAGEEVVAVRGDTVLARGPLARSGGRAQAWLELPMTGLEEPLAVTVGGRPCPVLPHGFDADRRRVLEEMGLAAAPASFSSAVLPAVGVTHPHRLHLALGGYRAETVYLDAAYREVVEADRQGRYGAVVTLRWRGGTTRRYASLYRLPAPADSARWRRQVRLDPQLPDFLFDGEEPVGGGGEGMRQLLRGVAADTLRMDPRAAGMIAALNDEPGRDPYLVDRAWWIGYKRRRDGVTSSLAPVAAPGAVAAAPSLEPGAPGDAGIDPAALAEIDATCRRWVRQNDDRFSVCIVRNGRVVFDRHFGPEVGRRGHLASITKVFTGILVMRAVEQGLLDLDEPLARWWPRCAPPPGGVPVTLRHLLNHTSGLDSYWGRYCVDLEERFADILPALHPGARWVYGNTGYELAADLVEHVAGKPWEVVVREQILDPLGCRMLTVPDASGCGLATARDLAVIGQLLLNGGAYGAVRILEEGSCAGMLPRPLALASDQAPRRHGIGLMPFPGDGLGPDCYGHISSAGSIFRVAPALGLVVTLLRENEGWVDYETFNEEFLRLVAASVPRGDPKVTPSP